MGNIIQIRHGSTVPTTSDLSHSYELGFATSTDSLYINNGSSIVRIGQKVLTGTSAPAAANGEDNDLYIQYSTDGNTTTVDAMFVKLSGAWVEISTGGGGASVIISTIDPSSSVGMDGSLYVKYHIDSNVPVVDAMYVKISGTWAEIATGGGGGGTGTVLTQVLTAGSTSVTFTDVAIKTTSMYQEFTSIYGVHATSIAVSTGTVVLTYEAQQYDMTVALAISTFS